MSIDKIALLFKWDFEAPSAIQFGKGIKVPFAIQFKKAVMRQWLPDIRFAIQFKNASFANQYKMPLLQSI